MLLYIFRRTFELLITLFAVITATFFLLKALPGSPFDDVEIGVDPEVQRVFEVQYGLDRPNHEQYFKYLGNVIQGDFGYSYQFPEESVTELIWQTLPVSIQLGALALILSLFFGCAFGLLAASSQNSWLDRALMLIASSGVSLPSFLVAPVLILFFSMHLKWLPAALWEGPSYWVLPVITLAVRPISIIARLVRISALDIVNKDFIAAARARGASEVRIFTKHVLKNSLIPVLGIFGQISAGVLSGSFVVEYIFAIPGAGKHMVDGVLALDYPIVMAMVILYTLLLSSAHWIIDVLMGWIDPRIRIDAKV